MNSRLLAVGIFAASSIIVAGCPAAGPLPPPPSGQSGSGWNVKIVWTDVYNGTEDTITFEGKITQRAPPITRHASNDPGFEAPPGSIAMVGSGKAEGSRAGWKSCNPGIDIVPSGNVDATFTAIVARDTITVAAYADLETALSGVWAPPIAVPVAGGIADYPPEEVRGDLCPRRSFGQATVTRFGTPPAP